MRKNFKPSFFFHRKMNGKYANDKNSLVVNQSAVFIRVLHSTKKKKTKLSNEKHIA